MNNYDVFRIEKIKIDDVAKAERHQKNRNNLNHERPQNKNEDITYERKKGITMLKQIKDKIKEIKNTTGKTTRKDAVVLYHMIMTYSPEMENKIGNDKKTREKWIKANTKFLCKKFGKENVLRIDLHRTETTTHIHAFVMPIFENKFNSKHFINNKYSLSELQDTHTEYVAEFGLKRGEKRVYDKNKEKIRHKPLRQYYNELKNNIDKLEQQKKELEKDILDDEIETKPKKEFVSEFDIDELY